MPLDLLPAMHAPHGERQQLEGERPRAAGARAARTDRRRCDARSPRPAARWSAPTSNTSRRAWASARPLVGHSATSRWRSSTCSSPAGSRRRGAATSHATYDATPARVGRATQPTSGDWGLPRTPHASSPLRPRARGVRDRHRRRTSRDHFRRLGRPTQRLGHAAARGWATPRSSAGSRTWVTRGGLAPTRRRCSRRIGAADPGERPAPRCSARSTRSVGTAPRLERMFGMDYRIEIYTPAPKRRVRLLHAAVPAGRPDRRPLRPQGRPQGRRRCWCRAAWREAAGRRRGPGADRTTDIVGPRGDGASTRMAAWLGLGRASSWSRGETSRGAARDAGRPSYAASAGERRRPDA